MDKEKVIERLSRACSQLEGCLCLLTTIRNQFDAMDVSEVADGQKGRWIAQNIHNYAKAINVICQSCNF